MASRKTKTYPRWRPDLHSMDLDKWRRVGVATTWVAGLVALGVLFVLGVPRLEAVASDSGWVDHAEVQFPGAPAWVSGELHDWLSELVISNMSGDPLRRDDLIGAHAALEVTGAFEQVDQVRRVRADLIVVEATFVVPWAVVRDPSGEHLIDRRGRLLPGSYRASEQHPFITLVGPSFDRPDKAGEEWAGGDVTAALHLIKLIDTRSWRSQVKAIDLRGFFRDDQLVIVTDGDSRIIWGAAPGEEGAREVPASQKLSYLDHNHRDYLHIDRGCHRLDVSGAVVTCLD